MSAIPSLTDGDYTQRLLIAPTKITRPFLNWPTKDAATKIFERLYEIDRASYTPFSSLATLPDDGTADPADANAYLLNEGEPQLQVDGTQQVRCLFAHVPPTQTKRGSVMVNRPSISGTFPKIFGNYRVFQPDTTLLIYDAYAAQTVTSDTGAPSAFYPTGGTYTLTFAGSTTGAIAYNAAAATVQTALNALTPISDRGGVTVSGSYNSAGGLVVTFNSYAATSADATSLTGYDDSTSSSSVAITNGGYTQSITISRVGGAVASGTADVSSLTVPSGATAGSAFSLSNNGRTQAVTLSASGIGSATSSINTGGITYSGTLSSEFSQSGTNFTLRITSSGGASGSFTLTAFGSTTGGLSLTMPGNASSGEATLAAVLSALNALSGVSAVGSFSGYVVNYSGGASTVEDMRMALTFTPKITGGTYTLTMFGQTTGAIAYNASLATIQSALNALSEVQTDRGGATVTGAGLASDGTSISFTITLPAGQFTGGTYTLTIFGQTTSALAYNATAGTVQAALNALSEVQTKRGGVVVGGSGLNAGLTAIDFTLTFANATFTASATSLTTAPCSITITPSSAPAGKVQTLIFAAAAVTRTLFCASHGLTVSDTLYLRTGATYYSAIAGTFAVPDANTIVLTIAASSAYAAAGTFTEVGKRTKQNYAPGSAPVACSIIMRFSTGTLVPDIYQGEGDAFLQEIFAGNTAINYRVGDLTPWPSDPSPIQSITTITVSAADL